MSDRAQVNIRVDGHDRVHVASTLRRLDPCVYPAVLGALIRHLGYEPPLLAKAITDPLDVDPRYPWLATLIQMARDDWERYGDRLVAQIEALLISGDLLPMTAANEVVLRQLFADHEVGIVLSFAGRHSDHETTERLVERGAVHPDYADRARVVMSYKLGRGLDALAAHAEQDTPTVAEVVERASRVQLTPQDDQAMAYAQRRAAIYMRRPAMHAATEADRVLTEAERFQIGAAVGEAVAERRSTQQTAKELRAAVRGTDLSNDMDRVARTELHFAHSHGAYVGLKEQAGRAGMDDPLVYKVVRPTACEDCKRIWGIGADPNTYRLSYIEAREAAGGNFRKPRSQWGPTVGPIHPNCTEGALLLYTPELWEATREAAKWLRETYRD